MRRSRRRGRHRDVNAALAAHFRAVRDSGKQVVACELRVYSSYDASSSRNFRTRSIAASLGYIELSARARVRGSLAKKRS